MAEAGVGGSVLRSFRAKGWHGRKPGGARPVSLLFCNGGGGVVIPAVMAGNLLALYTAACGW